jgi:type II secretion system protein J
MTRSQNPSGRRDAGRAQESGFTLLELLVALTLTATAFAVIWGVFASTLDAWRRGSDTLDRLHRGDFVFDRLEATLRSAAWYPSRPERYGFRMETAGDDLEAEDVFSWVTVSDAFEPRRTVRSQGMRRVTVLMEEGEDGKRVLAVRAQHVLSDPEGLNEPEADLLAAIPEIQGIRCEVYDKEDKEWQGEWSETNSLPERVRVTLTLEPIDKKSRPVVLQRIIPLPTARAAGISTPGGRAGAAESSPGVQTPPRPGEDRPPSEPSRRPATPPGPVPKAGPSGGRV